MTDLTLRGVSPQDVGFLGVMLYEAVHWRGGDPRPPMETTLAHPTIAGYLEAWGRLGDRGVVAAAGGQPLGATWYRLFPEHAPGYGFVASNVPELTLAVAPAHRGRGVGRALLAALLLQANLDGFSALSLSVAEDNPAVRLYRRHGFESVGRVGDAHTMVARLRGSGP